MISLGMSHTGILYDDGTVQFIGDNEHGQCNLFNVLKRKVTMLSLG